MQKEMLKEFYGAKKYLEYVPIPDTETYRKIDNDFEMVDGIYGKSFIFCKGKLLMIYSKTFEKGFEKYSNDLWLLTI